VRRSGDAEWFTLGVMIHRSTKIFLETVAAIALVAVVLAGAAVWRFSTGPISISGVTPYIETALSDPASGRRVTIGASSLVWDPDEHAIEVRADRVAVFDGDGKAVMVVPEMMVRFRLAALLRGVVAPRALTLVRPALTVVRAADGGWEFSAVPDADQGPAAAASGDSATVLELVERSLAQLDRFRLVDARLVIDDRRARAVWVLPRVAAGLQRLRGQLDAQLAFELDVEGRAVPIRVAARLDDAYQPIDVDVSVADLEVAKIAGRIEELRDLAALDLPLSGRVHYARDGAAGEPVLRFVVSGAAGQIVRPELADGRLPIANLALRGDYRMRADRLTIDEVVVGLPTAAITLKAEVADVTGNPAVEGSLALASLPLDDLRKYWPPEAGANARRWILANMSQGAIRDLALRFSARRTAGGLDVGALDGQMTVEGARVRYMRPQPPVEQVSGLVRFDTRHFDIAVRSGRSRGLVIESGQIDITGLETTDQQMAIRATIVGPISDTLTLLDLPPFGYVRRFGRTPQSITGEGNAQLALRFPLVNGLSIDDIGLTATATVSRLNVPRVVRDFDLTEGRFDLNLDKEGMGLIGRALIGGVPVTASWDEHFDRPVPYRRRYELSATASDAHRRALGVDLGDVAVGPIGVKMSYTEGADRRAVVLGTLDFGGTALKIADLGWSKPAGAPASGHFEGEITDGRVGPFGRADVAAPGLSLRAGGAFAQGRIDRLEIQELKTGATDIAGRVSWRGERLDVSLNGRSLDASALLGGDDVTGKPPRAMTVAAKFDRVLVGPGRQLAKVELRADADGKRWRSASMSGTVGTGGMTLNLMPEANGRALTVMAEDAGAVLRTFGLGDGVQGGHLKVDGRYDDAPGGAADDALNAHVAVEEFRMVRAPLLAKLLAVTSITGIPDLMSAEGIGFTEMSIQLAKTRDRLQITDGRASGTSLGLTAQGTISGPDDTADLTGTIVPVYSVNKLFGQIPVIGELVTGGGGGLFAFTYAVNGPLDNPSISVNPLSVLAPGFLRNLFRSLPNLVPEGEPPPMSNKQ
jgi:hypothetical protein